MLRTVLFASCVALAPAAFAQQPAEPPPGPSAAAPSDAPVDLSPEAKAARLAAAKEAFEKTITKRTGPIDIAEGAVALNVPEGFYFLDRTDARKVLEDLWGNPPDTTIEGMLFAKDASAFDADGWGVVLSYDPSGYVSDEDAAKINYDDLMRDMQSAQKEANPELIKSKYPSIEIVGWAAPPHYDASKHKMYWAKDLIFGGDGIHTLNYNMRVLGRKGVLELNFVAEMAALKKVEGASADVLAIADFKPGYRYQEYDPRVDQKADYGIAGLVAGGAAGGLLLAKKTGLITVLILFLKKAWVLIAAGLAGAGGVLSRMFGGKGKAKAAASGAAPAAGSLDAQMFGDKPADAPPAGPPDGGPTA